MSPINLWEVIGDSFPHPLCHPPIWRCVAFCLKVTKASETRLQPLGDPVTIAAWNMSKRGFIACWLCATGHCAKCFTLFTHLLLPITSWDRYSNLYSTGEETGSETRNTLLKSHSKSESRPELDPQSLWFQNLGGIPGHSASFTWNVPLTPSVPVLLLMSTQSKCLYRLTSSGHHSRYFTSIGFFNPQDSLRHAIGYHPHFTEEALGGDFAQYDPVRDRAGVWFHIVRFQNLSTSPGHLSWWISHFLSKGGVCPGSP